METSIMNLLKPIFNQKLNGKHILIVDPDEAGTALIRDALTGSGINIIHETKARHGIDTYKNHGRIELIVINTALPDMDCFEAALHLVAEGGSAPMLFLSGSFCSDNATLVGKSDIICDFIYQPITLLELAETIAKYISQSHPVKYSVADKRVSFN